jgi:hypothetical protein
MRSHCTWWFGIRKSVEDYIKECGPFQRRKEDREFIAPLGDAEETSAPFEVTAMDKTGPYLLAPLKNKYLLTLIYHFSKYMELFVYPKNQRRRVLGYMQRKLVPDMELVLN